MSDILTIKRLLAERAQSVAEMLVPSGKKNGREWQAGDIYGAPGESLNVCVSGVKAGIWQDFATGEGGDLLDLWVAVRRVPLSEALEQAQQWLGITMPEPTHKPRREYTRPPKPKCAKPEGGVLEYLTQSRKIPQSVLTAYKVAARGNSMVFPFLLPDGVLALAKEREAVDGAKPKPTAADCEPVLFGWQAIPENAREVVICEGEIDALSWAAYGYPALSVPFGGGGGGKQNWIESEFERMARFEKIYVAMDNDPVGEEGALEICQRLGRHRCYRVIAPRKDANQCLVDGVTADEMAASISGATSYQPEGLRHAAEFVAGVTALFWPQSGVKEGYSTPYDALAGKLYFRPSELTLWSGTTGSGKSQILSDCIVDWMRQGSRVCLSSLEMPATQILKRMCKQAGNVDRPTEPYIRAILNYLDGLYIYQKTGKEGVSALLEIFDYARARYGCDQFVIDSLMRLGIAKGDYDGQEAAVFQMVDWVMKNNVHLHLVAHARKGGKDSGVGESDDVAGAMEIGANAANILMVWRNRAHEEKIEKAPDEITKKELMEKPGVVLNVTKQRNGDWEGKTLLFFNNQTYQYRSTKCSKKARDYVQFSGNT